MELYYDAGTSVKKRNSLFSVVRYNYLHLLLLQLMDISRRIIAKLVKVNREEWVHVKGSPASVDGPALEFFGGG